MRLLEPSRGGGNEATAQERGRSISIAVDVTRADHTTMTWKQIMQFVTVTAGLFTVLQSALGYGVTIRAWAVLPAIVVILMRDQLTSRVKHLVSTTLTKVVTPVTDSIGMNESLVNVDVASEAERHATACDSRRRAIVAHVREFLYHIPPHAGGYDVETSIVSEAGLAMRAFVRLTKDDWSGLEATVAFGDPGAPGNEANIVLTLRRYSRAHESAIVATTALCLVLIVVCSMLQPEAESPHASDALGMYYVLLVAVGAVASVVVWIRVLLVALWSHWSRADLEAIVRDLHALLGAPLAEHSGDAR